MTEAKSKNNKRTLIIAGTALAVVIIALVAVLLTRPKPASFEISDLLITPEQSLAEQPITVQATVLNTGGSSGIYNAEFKIDGAVNNTQAVTVDAQESQTIVFLTAGKTPGTHKVEIGGLTGQFVIIASAADIRLSDLVIEPVKAAYGQAVSISVTLSNDGNAAGDYAAQLLVNGAAEETKSVSVSAGEKQQITFILRDKTAGKYTVAVAGLTGGFTVSPPPETVTVTPTTAPAATTELRTWIITDTDVARLFALISDKTLNAHFIAGNKAEYVLAGFPGWINVGIKNGKLCEFPVDEAIYALFPEIHDYIFFEGGVEYLGFTWFDPTVEIAPDVTEIPVMVSVTTEEGRAIVTYEWPARK